MAQVALIQVSETRADPFRTDELARGLRRELWRRGLAADFVSLPPSGGPGMASGGLVVSLFSGPAAAALAEEVCRWLSEGEGRAVKVTAGRESIELAAGGDEGRRGLVGWLLRHGCGAEGEAG
jgi:hypothetical protein